MLLDRAFALTRSVVDIALGVVGGIIERVHGSGDGERVTGDGPRAHSARPQAPPPVTRDPSPRPAEPIHIDTEDELVAEFAEAGAEDGAGPEIEVAEPWPGYAKLTASDVIDRLEAASEAERAVVALYERGHKKRKTVLAATGLTGDAR
jgi:hypothetical protein